MSESNGAPTTVVIRRPARVATDDHCRSTWIGEIEESELELMSTGELRRVLAAVDAPERDSIEAIAESDEQGILVRDGSTGVYGVVSDDDIRQFLERDGKSLSVASRLEETLVDAHDDAPDELSLVSTQALRRMLKSDEPESEPDESEGERGWNPYDRS